jgi:protein-tyrosine-phosphatase
MNYHGLMQRSVTQVLFVSRENACRSLLAEACLRHLGGKKFKVHSCGVPYGVADRPDSWAVLALQTAGIPTDGLRCKSWAEFTKSGAPKMDFVIALDAETAMDHPSWPGQPETALWEYPMIALGRKSSATTPAIATMNTLHSLRRRIELLVSLHSRVSSKSELRHDLRDLAHM